MAAATPVLSLYDEGLHKFRDDFKKSHPDSKYEKQLREYLKARGSAGDAKQCCESLRTETNKKYGGNIKFGDTEILKERWISNILGNIDNFVAVGNVAMTGAPESVGLAWFAITKALGAIQSNFQLYALFGSGLTDITEMMITIQHFDNLYDQRTKAEFEASDMVKSLFGHIRSIYAAILDFGFSVHRHISGGKMAQYRHAFKDIFGAEVQKFQGRIDLIVDLKKKVLEASDSAFQAKSFQRFDEIQDDVKGIQAHLSEVRKFQETSTELFQAQKTWQDGILKSLESVRASSRQKNRWEYAMDDFNKIKERLSPLKGTSGPLAEALDSRHEGTCQWIYEYERYTDWLSSLGSGTLCLTGHPGSGKSTLLASIVEKIDDETDDDKVIVQYMCDMSSTESGDKSPQSLARVVGTLVYQLYECATLDEHNEGLLEACNKVFSNPKQDRTQQQGSANMKSPELKDKAQKLMSAVKKDMDLPELADTLQQLSTLLQRKVVIAVDAVDRMSAEDQAEFIESLERLSRRPRTLEDVERPILVIMTSTVTPSASFMKVLDVSMYNSADVGIKLRDDLQAIPSLTQAEREEALEAIQKEAGSDFKYVAQVAVPFMKQPFQRPLSTRLKIMPKGISDAYKQFVQSLSSNYLQLLKTALQWTMFAPHDVRVVEIMDAYTGIYVPSDSTEQDTDFNDGKDGDDYKVRIASPLEVQQLKAAAGRFLYFHEDSAGEWWVWLHDTLQARQFCVREADADHDHVGEEASRATVCSNCESALERSDALMVTEKELHLRMALTCLRHLNTPFLQMKSGALPDFIKARMKADAPTAEINDDSSPRDAEANGHSQDVNGASLEESDGTRIVVGSDLVSGSEEQAPATPIPAVVEDHQEPQDSQEPHSRTGTAVVTEHDEVTGAPTKEQDTSTMFPDCLDCSASDDSAVDDDLRGLDWASDTQETNSDEEGMFEYWQQETAFTFRYEANCWYYHLRRAESLWSPEQISGSPEWSELKTELDRFVKNDKFFKRWQWILYLREFEGGAKLPYKPLHIATFLGLTSWAGDLIAQGHGLAEISDGCTPLHTASLRADSLPMLTLLLKHGADPNATDDDVGIACLNRWMGLDQSYEAVKLFDDHQTDLAKRSPRPFYSGEGPLHIFASHANDESNMDVLTLLLNGEGSSNRSDINVQDDYHQTPLHYLLSRRDVPKKLLKELIARNIDVNAEDTSSRRPLQNASYWGDMEVVRTLLPHVSDINDPDRHGRTALHEAAWAGHKELVEILLDNKAKPNVTDHHNRTPLFFACLTDPGGRIGNARETIKVLLETLRKEDLPLLEINKETTRKRTPLRQAAARGFDDVVKEILLMMRASDTNTATSVNLADTRNRRTALHCASAGGHLECARLLIEFGADVTIEDKSSKTALVLCYEQWALSNQPSFEATALLLCDHDPSAAAKDTELPGIAATNGSKLVLEKLGSLNADLALPDRYGWTPFALAKRSESIDAKNYLEKHLARDAQLPTRWLDPGICTSLSESGLNIEHVDVGRRALSSDRPLPAHLASFYFEIKSLPMPTSKPYPEMAIGFCTLGASGLKFPGWNPHSRAPNTRSWAYHGDDGGFYGGDGSYAEPYLVPYKPEDVVGCGVDLEEGRMWFTRNGERLKKEFEGVRGRLYPVVGLLDDVKLETRFAEPYFSTYGAKKVESSPELQSSDAKQPVTGEEQHEVPPATAGADRGDKEGSPLQDTQ